MNNNSGYSATPLARKLGLKPGMRVLLVNPPDSYKNWFSSIDTEHFHVLTKSAGNLDFTHVFCGNKAELRALVPMLAAKLCDTGMMWISWPKQSAKISTDVNREVVRDFGITAGLVDIKVCAVDETWSALKFVIPFARRRLRN